MGLKFRDNPGWRERHIQRKSGNPLFPPNERRFTQEDVTKARKLDQQELVEFMQQMGRLVKEITNLEPHVDSEVVLELKARADRYYEQCTGLPTDQEKIKRALVSLINTMMSAITKGAGNDAKALAELEQEQAARQTHYALLENKLTGDLLREESAIGPNDLVPILLSESIESLKQILGLFDASQLKSIRADALTLVQQGEREGIDLLEVAQKLNVIESAVIAEKAEP